MNRFFLIILLFWHVVATATVTMSIAPSTAQLGDTVELTLTLDNTHSKTLPDITPLEENFTIVGTQHNQSYSVINGVTHATNQWIIVLMPKKTGLLTIPPLHVGTQSSNPSQILIKSPQAAATNNENKDIIFRGTISKNNPFINEQVVYTVKLYSTLRLLEVEYQPPEIEDALLIPLGEGRRYHETIHGREYAVDEQQYAIFPQKSGPLQLIPPSLKALIYDEIPTRIQKQAKPIQLTVKARTEKHWLPAKQVTLTERYDIPTHPLKTGDTITRSITLEAVGVPAQLLPTIHIKNSPQYQAYPEKPTTSNTLRQQELVGTSAMTIVYVLNKAGTVTLAPIQLTWFNTQTEQQETSILPKRQLTVHAKQTTIQTPKQAKPVKAIPTVSPPSASTAWWIATMFGCGGLITLVGLWLYRNKQQLPATNNQARRQAIQLACNNNNPAQAQTALLQWASHQWPTVTILNLNDIIKLITNNPSLQQQIQHLSQALYSQQPQQIWHGKPLWQSIKSYKPKKRKKR